MQSLFNIAVLLKAGQLVSPPLPSFESTILSGLALRHRTPFPRDFIDSLENVTQNSKVMKILSNFILSKTKLRLSQLLSHYFLKSWMD